MFELIVEVEYCCLTDFSLIFVLTYGDLISISQDTFSCHCLFYGCCLLVYLIFLVHMIKSKSFVCYYQSVIGYQSNHFVKYKILLQLLIVKHIHTYTVSRKRNYQQQEILSTSQQNQKIREDRRKIVFSLIFVIKISAPNFLRNYHFRNAVNNGTAGYCRRQMVINARTHLETMCGQGLAAYYISRTNPLDCTFLAYY